jgi:hypothetical protein
MGDLLLLLFIVDGSQEQVGFLPTRSCKDGSRGQSQIYIIVDIVV